MHKSEFEKIFLALCDAFQSSPVYIITKDNQTVFSSMNEDFKSKLFHDTFTGERNVSEQEIDSVRYCRITLPISSHHQLFVYLPVELYRDPNRNFAMIEAIIATINEQKKHPANNRGMHGDAAVLLNKLFHSSSAEDMAYAALLAAELGFNMAVDRAVCIFKVESESDYFSDQNQLLYSIIQIIKNHPDSSTQDIVGSFGNNYVVLCRKLKDVQVSYKAQLNGYITSLHEQISAKFNIGLLTAIGLSANNIMEYSDALVSAQTAITYAHNSKHIKLVFIQDYMVEYELQKIPPPVLQHFLSDYIQILNDNPVLLETVEALVLHNMDTVSAANYLYIHRNTAVFRINQLKAQLGLNPLHNDNDRFVLILIYTYYQQIIS